MSRVRLVVLGAVIVALSALLALWWAQGGIVEPSKQQPYYTPSTLDLPDDPGRLP